MNHKKKMNVQVIIALICDVLLIPVSVLLYHYLGKVEFSIVILVLLFLAVANSILSMVMQGDHDSTSSMSFCKVKFKTFLTLYRIDRNPCVLKPTIVHTCIERPGGFRHVTLYFSKLDTIRYLIWKLRRYKWRDKDEYEIMKDIRKYISYKISEEKQNMEDNTDEHENV